jgi:U3 small nucleolar RNA-associated protein 14
VPSNASSTTLKSSDIHSLAGATPTVSPINSQILSDSRSRPSQQPQSEYNPWLSRNGQSSHTALKKSEIAISKDSTTAVKAKNKLRKKQKETEDEAAKAQEDAVLDIFPADLLVESLKQAKPGGDNSDAADEVEEQEERLKQKGKPRGTRHTVLEQRELVTKAFAGDNVIEVRAYVVSIWCSF